MNRTLLEDEAKRLEEDLLWSMVANFQIATYWRVLHWIVGIPSVIIAAATGVAAVKAGNPDLIAILAVVSAVFGALSTFMNPQRSAREFHNSGVRCSALRGKLRRYWQIDVARAELSDETLRKSLEKLAEEKSHLMETTPHTGGLAYWMAHRSIAKGHNKHLVDSANN